MNTVVSKDFETTDLYFAAFLKAAKVPWLGAFPDSRDAKRVKFRFETSPSELKDLQHAYFSRSPKSKIVPLNYADEIKALKAMTRI